MFTTLKHRHLSVFALALLTIPSFAQIENLTCFTDGLVGDCSSFTNTFCTASGSVPIGGQNSVAQCFESPQGFRCDFNAWRGGAPNTTAAKTFSQQNCELVLQTASAVCPMGGSGRATSGGTVIFTIDPNAGSCGDNSAEPSG